MCGVLIYYIENKRTLVTISYLMISKNMAQKHISTANTDSMLENSATETSIAVKAIIITARTEFYAAGKKNNNNKKVTGNRRRVPPRSNGSGGIFSSPYFRTVVGRSRRHTTLNKRHTACARM